jgi:hypothetical protein
MQNLNYKKNLAPGGLGPAVMALAAVLCVVVFMLLFGVGPTFLCWAILALGVFFGISLIRIALDPTGKEIRIIGDKQTVSIHLPGKGTRIIPVDRISKIVGIAHEWGLAHGGDEVDFEIHWDGRKLRLSEEILMESGLRRFLSQLPGFDENTLQEAQVAALRGVPLWGKRFLLLHRSNLET